MKTRILTILLALLITASAAPRAVLLGAATRRNASAGPAFVSYTENGTNTSPLTLTAPSSIANGNLLLIFVSSEEVTTTPVAPAGFSTLQAKSSGYGTALTIFYKIASSESGSYAVTGPAYMSGSIVNISGANASQPDVIGTPNGSLAAGATVNGITTTAAGLLFCYIGSNSSGSMGVPSGFTACGNIDRKSVV